MRCGPKHSSGVVVIRLDRRREEIYGMRIRSAHMFPVEHAPGGYVANTRCNSFSCTLLLLSDKLSIKTSIRVKLSAVANWF